MKIIFEKSELKSSLNCMRTFMEIIDRCTITKEDRDAMREAMEGIDVAEKNIDSEEEKVIDIDPDLHAVSLRVTKENVILDMEPDILIASNDLLIDNKELLMHVINCGYAFYSALQFFFKKFLNDVDEVTKNLYEKFKEKIEKAKEKEQAEAKSRFEQNVDASEFLNNKATKTGVYTMNNIDLDHLDDNDGKKEWHKPNIESYPSDAEVAKVLGFDSGSSNDGMTDSGADLGTENSKDADARD
jgi:hypothetical protein